MRSTTSVQVRCGRRVEVGRQRRLCRRGSMALGQHGVRRADFTKVAASWSLYFYNHGFGQSSTKVATHGHRLPACIVFLREHRSIFWQGAMFFDVSDNRAESAQCFNTNFPYIMPNMPPSVASVENEAAFPTTMNRFTIMHDMTCDMSYDPT